MDGSTVRRSESIAALAKAMCAAQAELRNPPKDSVNPHFKSRYADLATVRDCVIPVLVKHGLTLMQFPSDLAGAPALTTVLAHTSGEFIEATAKLNPVKPDPQGVGSALTYMRRYALQSVAGVAADDDDDGHAGSQQRQAKPPAPVNAGRATNPPPDNLELRAMAVQAYEGCGDMERFRQVGQQIKADADKFSPADKAAINQAAGAAQDRLVKKAAPAA